jgi:hypothetical protein
MANLAYHDMLQAECISHVIEHATEISDMMLQEPDAAEA